MVHIENPLYQPPVEALSSYVGLNLGISISTNGMNVLGDICKEQFYYLLMFYCLKKLMKI